MHFLCKVSSIVKLPTFQRRLLCSMQLFAFGGGARGRHTRSCLTLTVSSQTMAYPQARARRREDYSKTAAMKSSAARGFVEIKTVITLYLDIWINRGHASVWHLPHDSPVQRINIRYAESPIFLLSGTNGSIGYQQYFCVKFGHNPSLKSLSSLSENTAVPKPLSFRATITT